MSLRDRFARHLRSLGLPPGRAIVAVSGGPDSVALLDLLWRSREEHGLDLLVAHADHGIHPESAMVARRVAALARAYELPVVVERLGLGAGASETRAREARYEWLRTLARETGARYLFTAHHADDQVETVLLRVLGGSGPAGLAGMGAVSPMPPGHSPSAVPLRRGTPGSPGRALVRPLLPFRAATIRRYLAEHGLSAWQDPANADPAHVRSWVRTELLPVIRARIPDVDRRLSRLARQALLARTAWDQALDLLPGLRLEQEREAVSVDRTALLAFPRALQVTVLTALARRAGWLIGPARAGRALRALRRAGSGASADLGGGWRLECTAVRFRVVPAPSGPEPEPILLEGPRGEAEWGGWRLAWQVEPAPPPADQGRDGLTAWFAPARLRVRSWRAGDRLRPMRGRGRRLAVRCFQDKRVPRSELRRWQLVEEEGELLWIPGVCRSDGRVPGAGEPAVRVDVARC